MISNEGRKKLAIAHFNVLQHFLEGLRKPTQTSVKMAKFIGKTQIKEIPDQQ